MSTDLKSSVQDLASIIEQAKDVRKLTSGKVSRELDAFIKSASAAYSKAAQALKEEKDDNSEADSVGKLTTRDDESSGNDSPEETKDDSSHEHEDGEVDRHDIDEVRDLVEQVADGDLDDDEVEELVEEKAEQSQGLRDFVDHELNEENINLQGDEFKHTEVFTKKWDGEEGVEAFEDEFGNRVLVHPSGKPSDNPDAWAASEKEEIERETSNMKEKIMGLDKQSAKGKGIPLPKKKIKQNPNADSSKVQVPENGGQALKASLIEKEVLSNGSFKVGSTEIRVNDDMEVELWSDGSGRAASLADMDTVINDFIGIVDHKRKLAAANKFNYSTITMVKVPCESCGEITAHEFTKNAAYECGCGHETAPEGVNALVKLGHLTMAYGVRAEHKNEKQFSRIASVLENADETDADTASVFAVYASLDDANEAVAKLNGLGGRAAQQHDPATQQAMKQHQVQTKINSIAENTVLRFERALQKIIEAEKSGKNSDRASEARDVLQYVDNLDGISEKLSGLMEEASQNGASDYVQQYIARIEKIKSNAQSAAAQYDARFGAANEAAAQQNAQDFRQNYDPSAAMMSEGAVPQAHQPAQDQNQQAQQPAQDSGIKMTSSHKAQLIPGGPLMQSGPKKKDDSDDDKSEDMPSDVPPSEAISAAFTNYKAQGMDMMKAIREFMKEHSGMVDSGSWSPSDDAAVISMLTKYWSGSKPAGLSDSAPLPVDDMPLMLQAQKFMQPKIRKPKDHVNVKKKPLGKDSAGEDLLPLPSGKIKQQVKPQGKMPKTDLGKDTSSMDWNDPGTAAKSPKKFKMSDVLLGDDSEGNEPFATPAPGSKPKSRK